LRFWAWPSPEPVKPEGRAAAEFANGTKLDQAIEQPALSVFAHRVWRRGRRQRVILGQSRHNLPCPLGSQSWSRGQERVGAPRQSCGQIDGGTCRQHIGCGDGARPIILPWSWPLAGRSDSQKRVPDLAHQKRHGKGPAHFVDKHQVGEHQCRQPGLRKPRNQRLREVNDSAQCRSSLSGTGASQRDNLPCPTLKVTTRAAEGRRDVGQITLFDLVGFAIEDFLAL